MLRGGAALCTVLLAATGCHLRYRAPKGLTPDSGAVVKLHSMKPLGGGERLDIDVYALNEPCAYPESLGRVSLEGRADDHVLVPTDGPVTFVSQWAFDGLIEHLRCNTEMTFAPEQGRRYVLMFGSDIGKHCISTIFESVRDADGKTRLVKHAPFVKECPRTGRSRPWEGPSSPREH